MAPDQLPRLAFILIPVFVLFKLARILPGKILMQQNALLGFLVHYAPGKHSLRAESKLARLPAGILLCMAAGPLDEVIQYFPPGRSFIWHDVFVNGASGVLTVVVLAYCLPGARG